MLKLKMLYAITRPGTAKEIKVKKKGGGVLGRNGCTKELGLGTSEGSKSRPLQD